MSRICDQNNQPWPWESSDQWLRDSENIACDPYPYQTNRQCQKPCPPPCPPPCRPPCPPPCPPWPKHECEERCEKECKERCEKRKHCKEVTATSAFAANTTGATLTFVNGVVAVPLPNNQNIGRDITVNASNTIFTVEDAGRYYITYQVNFAAPTLVNSTLLINGVPFPAATLTPSTPVTQLNNDVIVTLPAGSTIELRLSSNTLPSVNLAFHDVGAALTIIRLS